MILTPSVAISLLPLAPVIFTLWTLGVIILFIEHYYSIYERHKTGKKLTRHPDISEVYQRYIRVIGTGKGVFPIFFAAAEKISLPRRSGWGGFG